MKSTYGRRNRWVVLKVVRLNEIELPPRCSLRQFRRQAVRALALVPTNHFTQDSIHESVCRSRGVRGYSSAHGVRTVQLWVVGENLAIQLFIGFSGVLV